MKNNTIELTSYDQMIEVIKEHPLSVEACEMIIAKFTRYPVYFPMYATKDTVIKDLENFRAFWNDNKTLPLFLDNKTPTTDKTTEYER